MVSLLLTLFSCSKDDFDEKRNNIVGEWKVTQASQEIRADTVYAESSFTFSISFNMDGTGTKETFIDVDINFEWLYQYNPGKVVISGMQSGPIIGSVQFYDVLKNEANRQIWTFDVKPPNGVVDVYRHTWKMDRQ